MFCRESIGVLCKLLKLKLYSHPDEIGSCQIVDVFFLHYHSFHCQIFLQTPCHVFSSDLYHCWMFFVVSVEIYLIFLYLMKCHHLLLTISPCMLPKRMFMEDWKVMFQRLPLSITFTITHYTGGFKHEFDLMAICWEKTLFVKAVQTILNCLTTLFPLIIFTRMRTKQFQLQYHCPIKNITSSALP